MYFLLKLGIFHGYLGLREGNFFFWGGHMLQKTELVGWSVEKSPIKQQWFDTTPKTYPLAKRRNIYKPPVFGFHVSFLGCTSVVGCSTSEAGSAFSVRWVTFFDLFGRLAVPSKLRLLFRPWNYYFFLGGGHQKENIIFQRSIFRCELLVSVRVYNFNYYYLHF